MSAGLTLTQLGLLSSSVAWSEFARRERLRRAGPPPPILGETTAKTQMITTSYVG